MKKRELFDIKKLNDFISWLNKNGYETRAGKGVYQALQVKLPKSGWHAVFYIQYLDGHYSVNEKLLPIIRRFISVSKKG